MNKEEFMKEIIDSISLIEPKSPISVYESVNVAELNKVIDRYKTIPNYDLLIKENNKLKERIDKAIKLLKEDYFEDGSGNNVEEVIKILKGENND